MLPFWIRDKAYLFSAAFFQKKQPALLWNVLLINEHEEIIPR